LKTFTWKSLVISVALALAAGLATCALWRMGLIDSLQSAFVVPVARGEVPLQSPQPWLGLLFIVAISSSAGFLVSRAGARRSFVVLGLGFLAMCGASLLTSKYFKVDILFAPMALGALGATFVVQLYRLWLIDSVLTDHLAETAARTDTLESEAQARLMSGLKLLQTILPLEESIVCQQNENGRLVPCARLRAGPGGSLDTNRNTLWRKLIQVGDRAVKTGEIARVRAGEIDELESVAIPLRHEQRTVGALLLRLRETSTKAIGACSQRSATSWPATCSAKTHARRS